MLQLLIKSPVVSRQHRVAVDTRIYERYVFLPHYAERMLLAGTVVGHSKHTIAHLVEHIDVGPQEMEHSYGVGHNQRISHSHRKKSHYLVRRTERTAPLELLDDEAGDFFFLVVFFFSGFFSVFFLVVVVVFF